MAWRVVRPAAPWMHEACWRRHELTITRTWLARVALGGDDADDLWRCSRHGALPLCRAGKAGSEHLLQWCPAVQAALKGFAPEAH